METVKEIYIGMMQPFDPTGDPTSIGNRWKRWIRAFELYSDGKGVTNDNQKKALLLHSAGMKVQDIYYTFPLALESSVTYEKVKDVLGKHFLPQLNTIYERHIFCEMYQFEHETVDQFVTRLRDKITDCGYDSTLVEQQLLDQVVHKC